MKCEYCKENKNRLYHTFKYGFICWKCLNEKTIKKQKCINPNCNKEFDLKNPRVIKKDRCNACYTYFERHNKDRTKFPIGYGGSKKRKKIDLEYFERKKQLENHLLKLNKLREEKDLKKPSEEQIKHYQKYSKELKDCECDTEHCDHCVAIDSWIEEQKEWYMEEDK